MSLSEAEILNRKEKALMAIKMAFGTPDDEYGATLFVNHHLEEIEKEYWLKHFGSESPSPKSVLEILELKSHWDEDSIFDFTLPEKITNYVISVSFNESGKVIEITMES